MPIQIARYIQQLKQQILKQYTICVRLKKCPLQALTHAGSFFGETLHRLVDWVLWQATHRDQLKDILPLVNDYRLQLKRVVRILNLRRHNLIQWIQFIGQKSDEHSVPQQSLISSVSAGSRLAYVNHRRMGCFRQSEHFSAFHFHVFVH